MNFFNGNTDREWEKFGKDDPYYGVVSHAKYAKGNLSEEHKADFFNSGRVYIESVLEKIRARFDPDFTIKRAIDFGCGVGRLVLPLSAVANEVTGVDVSASMLDEARKNCDANNIRNVVLVKSDDTLSQLKGKYDFIHSFIVFQHIPAARGEVIFDKLLEHLESNGVCVVHFTYAKADRVKEYVKLVKEYVPLAANVINVVRGRKFFAPQMQMNSYNLNRLMAAIQKANVGECYTEFTNHGGELGVILYFRKP